MSASPKHTTEPDDNQDMKKVNELIKICKREKMDSKISLQKFDDLLNEASISQ